VSALRVGVATLGLLLGACGGTTYAIQPAAATQLDDADWVIKHEPQSPQAVAPAGSVTPPPPEPALPSPAEAKP
jgi:hypothetical protein